MTPSGGSSSWFAMVQAGGLAVSEENLEWSAVEKP